MGEREHARPRLPGPSLSAIRRDYSSLGCKLLSRLESAAEIPAEDVLRHYRIWRLSMVANLAPHHSIGSLIRRRTPLSGS